MSNKKSKAMRDNVVAFRFTNEEVQYLEDRASEEMITKSAFIRRAMYGKQ